MRALLALLLLGGVASAEKIEPLDMCQAQVSSLLAEIAKARAELAAAKQAEHESYLRDKYKLGDGDGVDPKTLEIKRAPKVMAKEAKAKAEVTKADSAIAAAEAALDKNHADIDDTCYRMKFTNRKLCGKDECDAPLPPECRALKPTAPPKK